MSYTKTTWAAGKTGGTLITAARLNNLEAGVEGITNSVEGAWTAWTSHATAGFSGSPTVTCRYKLTGKTCTVYYAATGTSNATTLTFTLPAAAKSAVMYLGPVIANSGTTATTPGRIALTAGSTTATVTRDGSGATWTNSGTKTVNGFVFTYEVD